MGGVEVAAAVVSVVEMPRLSTLDELVAAAAADLAGGDEWLELSTAGDVRVGSRGRVDLTGASSLPRSCGAVHQRIAIGPLSVRRRTFGRNASGSTTAWNPGAGCGRKPCSISVRSSLICASSRSACW